MPEIGQVWVAYALPERQFLIGVAFREGMTAREAIEKSGLAQQVELPAELQLGIFGIKIADQNQCLTAGDRVEIYRPLIINPKDIRRKRAEKNPVGRYSKSDRLKRLK